MKCESLRFESKIEPLSEFILFDEELMKKEVKTKFPCYETLYRWIFRNKSMSIYKAVEWEESQSLE